MWFCKTVDRIPVICSVSVECQKGCFSEVFKNKLACIQCARSSGSSVLLGVCGVYIKRLEAVGTSSVPGPAHNEGCIFRKFKASRLSS